MFTVLTALCFMMTILSCACGPWYVLKPYTSNDTYNCIQAHKYSIMAWHAVGVKINFYETLIFLVGHLVNLHLFDVNPNHLETSESLAKAMPKLRASLIYAWTEHS